MAVTILACLNTTHHFSDLCAFLITSGPQEELTFHFVYQENKVHVKGIITSNYARTGLDKCCY